VRDIDRTAEYLFAYLRDILYHPDKAKLDLEQLPDDFRRVGEGLHFLAQCVDEGRALAKSLSLGNLSAPIPSAANELTAPLKSLQASLKHMTWQTQQVAKGDYRQKVEFMGEFAEAFNTMIRQLDERQQALTEQIASGQRKTIALEQSFSLLEVITQHISQWIIVVDGTSGEWIFTNHSAEEILEHPDEEFALKTWMLSHLEDQRGASEEAHELSLVGKEGVQWFSVVNYAVHWRGRNGVAFVVNDISDQKKQIFDLEYLAYKDSLTKLDNRHFGKQTLRDWITAQSQFVLCFADIDNLKYVNDEFGHPEGDVYILWAAEALRRFSPDAVVSRLGGDEFMILAQGWTAEQAQAKLETLRDWLIQSGEEMEPRYKRGFSFGVVEVSAANTLSDSELLAIVDERMYAYKMQHKVQRGMTLA
jgi:diguanylate cyclase (GGDEF)-like protein